MNQLKRLAKIAIWVGLLGIAAVYAYAVSFGGNHLLPILYAVLLTTAVLGVVGTLIPRWLQVSAVLREDQKADGRMFRRGHLFILGLFLCALPGLLLYIISKVFVEPSEAGMLIASVVAVLLLVSGVYLLFYSYLDWLGTVRRHLHPK